MEENLQPRTLPSKFVPGIGTTPAIHPLGALQIEVKPARMGMLGLSPVFPAMRYRQEELLEALGYAGNEAAEKIFRATRIESRHVSVAPETLPFPDGVAQHELIGQALTALCLQAARGALRTSRVEPAQLGCVIVHASSGYQLPGLASRLVNALKLPPDLVKYDLTGAGCVGAMPMMSLADDYLKAHPDKRVLAIVAEVPSAGLGVRNPHDKGEIVVNALFGDGAVGLVLGAAGADPGFPEVVDLHYLQQYDTLDVVYAVAEAGGVLGAHVERGMADHAATIFGPAVDELLERHRLSRDDIRHWVFHPGGPAILERLQAEFSLTDAQLAPTWETLKHCGNASGPTCLIALNRLIHEQPPQRGDWGILGAIGPGLTVGVALLQW